MIIYDYVALEQSKDKTTQILTNHALQDGREPPFQAEAENSTY